MASGLILNKYTKEQLVGKYFRNKITKVPVLFYVTDYDTITDRFDIYYYVHNGILHQVEFPSDVFEGIIKSAYKEISKFEYFNSFIENIPAFSELKKLYKQNIFK